MKGQRRLCVTAARTYSVQCTGTQDPTGKAAQWMLEHTREYFAQRRVFVRVYYVKEL